MGFLCKKRGFPHNEKDFTIMLIQIIIVSVFYFQKKSSCFYKRGIPFGKSGWRDYWLLIPVLEEVG